eukprot:CAMPEP_0179417884 /NCGR_PEP_ID=MMETSP0799-20121207/7624_1 /TAXON_ID=46947 /ORGANISM="Geminigera cryophila, Strain CCMP2564" /LENGTH=65 /DNA_ID=CAMNT_0021190961 /DNA_START=240 /DNA_END=434 /DNA_ORIENTATION=+
MALADLSLYFDCPVRPGGMCTNAGPRDGKFISAPRVPGVDLVLLAFDLVRIATQPSAAEFARREF